MAKVASAPLLDHRLGQRVRVDRPRGVWRPARKLAHCGNHIFPKSKLQGATLASVPHLHWL